MDADVGICMLQGRGHAIKERALGYRSLEGGTVLPVKLLDLVAVA